MREIPILFSTIMVQANLDGRKSQTRRIAAVPVGDHHGTDIMDWRLSKHPYQKDGKWWYNIQTAVDDSDVVELKNKYGQPGDLIYGREEHYRYGAWIEKEGEYTKGGRQKWMFVPHTDEILYEPPAEYKKGRHHKDPYTPAWHKRLARFMPKSSARIWLQVTDIRVERLQDISEEEAKAEGAEGLLCQYMDGSGQGYTSWVGGFKEIWIKINGPESWDANPWIWVIKYKVLSTTGKPNLQTIKTIA